MPDSLRTLLDLLAQFTGGRGGTDVRNFVIAAIFWASWLAVAVARYREDHRPRERLLIWGFSIALTRELFMIFVAVLRLFKVVDAADLVVVFPPLQHALHDAALIAVAAGFLGYLTHNDAIARRYLWAGMTAVSICYAVTAWWWAGFVRAHPMNFAKTWCDWVFHLNGSFWLLVALVYLARRTDGWSRNIVCSALLLFLLSTALKLPDLAEDEANQAIFTPIRYLLYLMGSFTLGGLFVREQFAERRAHARSLILSLREREQAEQQVRQLLTETEHARVELAKSLEDQRRTERALRESESRYIDLYDNAPDMFLSVDTETRRIIRCNATIARMTGYTKEEIIGRPISEMYHASCRPRVSELLATLKATGELRDVELRVLCKDGRVLDVSMDTSAVRDASGRVVASRSIWHDITERKQAQVQLQASHDQLRALTARLETIREEQSTQIAREIHDELGQQLTALTLDLAWLERRVTGMKESGLGAEVATKLGAMTQSVENSIRTVQKIARELRPAMLDNIDFATALEREAHNFTQRSGVRCVLDLPSPRLTLDDAQATGMFRIFQEALTNIARHAHASDVHVRLAREAPGLVLEVRDNGRGIAPEEREPGKSLGLLGMSERARLIGGSLVLHSEPGKGTTVTLALPPTNGSPANTVANGVAPGL